jgi:hypothetical protein
MNVGVFAPVNEKLAGTKRPTCTVAVEGTVRVAALEPSLASTLA